MNLVLAIKTLSRRAIAHGFLALRVTTVGYRPAAQLE